MCIPFFLNSLYQRVIASVISEYPDTIAILHNYYPLCLQLVAALLLLTGTHVAALYTAFLFDRTRRAMFSEAYKWDENKNFVENVLESQVIR